MESKKKNELEPTEIAEHLKRVVGGDFFYISPEAYRRLRGTELKLILKYWPTVAPVVESAVKGRPAREPRLRTLIAWNDLLPSPGLRKQTAKMLADQQAHIAGLQAKRRHTAARWQVCCSYGLWAWYIAARPVSMLVKTLKGKFGGT